MNLTALALGRDRLTLVAVLLFVLCGLYLYADYPSQEEPTLPINQALITAENPALTAVRMEELVARPIERRLRELRETKTIETTVRAGSVLVKLEIQDGTPDYDLAWQRVREKMADTRVELPEGTAGPFVDDDFGRVAVATVAVTAPGYAWRDIRSHVLALRDRITAIPGVERVSIHGLVGERVTIETASAVLARYGLSPDAIAQTLRSQNVILPGGRVELGGIAATLDPSGAYATPADIADTLIALPSGASARLGDVATVRRTPVDPLTQAAFQDGQPAVVLAISMAPGRNMITFNQGLRNHLLTLEQTLPIGFSTTIITDQGKVVDRVIDKMMNILMETIAVVMLVTVAALGLRAGSIVGVSVPITMLTSLAILRPLGVELNQVSTAAFIIALGILVDNANVIVDDTVRRMGLGAPRREAALTAGTKLALPLLISTLTVILAFAPPVFTDNLAAIYMQTLTIVMTVTLLVSWVVALTVVPLLTARFAPPVASTAALGEAVYAQGAYAVAGRVFDLVIRRPLAVIATLFAVLVASLLLAGSIPAAFLPASDRPQIQIPVETAPGTMTGTTAELARQMTAWLNDDAQNPEVVTSLAYVGEGGPRFILGLNPPNPAPHRAYLVVNVTPETDTAALVERLQRTMSIAFPQARVEPKLFSLGETEAGQAMIRIGGTDEATLRKLADQVKTALLAVPGTINVSDDWEHRLLRVKVDLDEAAARRAGVTLEDVAASLSAITAGEELTILRDGDILLPIVWRAMEADRAAERLPDMLVRAGSGGQNDVFLSEVARLDLVSEPAVIQKRDLQTTITIVARNPGLTAEELVAAVRPTLDALALPPQARWWLGGEIKENAVATEAVFAFLPLCMLMILLLFVYQFNSFRKVAIVLASIPFCMVGVVLILVLLRAPFDFIANLGLFALVGTIVSNAILVLEQIEEEEAVGRGGAEAVRMACLKRLRPIMTTQATTILGLMPLMLSVDPLWYSFNLVVVGGLTAGTLGSLGIVPALYMLLFVKRQKLVEGEASRTAGAGC